MKGENLFKKTASIVAAATLLTSLTSGTLGTTVVFAATTKPNVVLIMCDQLRSDAIGAYGNTQARTPNMDQLAKDGTLYTYNYSNSPVCVPSRYSVLSGQYPFQTGIYGNGDSGWISTMTTYPEEFGKNGYKTYNSGKEHVSTPSARPIWQQSTVIETYAAQTSTNVLGPGFLESDYKLIRCADDNSPTASFFSGIIPEIKKNVIPTSDIIDKAMTYIDASRAAGSPFMVTVSILDPHTPVVVLPEYFDMFDMNDMNYDIATQSEIDAFAVFEKERQLTSTFTDKIFRRMRATYAALVTSTDFQIGRLITKLKNDGIYDNTIIVLCADHGCINGEFHQSGKSRFIDYSVRVPLIIKAPGLAQNVINNELTENVDIAGTMLAAAGIAVPTQMQQNKNLFNPNAPLKTEVISQIGGGVGVRGYIRTKEFAMDMNTHFDRGQVTETLLAADEDGQLIDLRNDPLGHVNQYNNPAYKTIIQTLEARLRLRIQK